MKNQHGMFQVCGLSALRTAALCLAAAGTAGAAFAEQPDKWVSYVEATGAQYVDTGVAGRCGTKAECKVEWMDFSDSAFLAARNGAWDDAEHPDGRLYFCYCLDSYGNMYTALNTGSTVGWYKEYTWWDCRFEKNRVYTYVAEFSAPDGAGMSTNTVKVDGQSIWNSTTNALDTGLNLYLFANNQKGSAAARSKARCYGLKIWQSPAEGGDPTLVRDFQPCMKGGRAGLYDAVSGDIFYSASGTDLVCDEDSETPDEFIDYVESLGAAATGSGQLPTYVDTGVTGRSGTKAAGEFSFPSGGRDEAILDARDGNTRFYLLHNYYGSFMYGYVTAYDTGVPVPAEEVCHVESELKAGSQVVTARGEDGETRTVANADDSSEVDTGLNLYLFAINYGGSVSYPGRGRCHGLRIWQDGNLVRDFRPCLKNGVAGLYDDVTKRIFYSSGTPFSYDTRKSVAEEDVRFVEYIESDGSNTLDTGVPARSGTRAAGEMSWVGEPRSWYLETYRYLESVPAVFYRQQRAYLASIAPGGGRFFMLLSYDTDLIAGYGEGSGGVLYPQIGGANIKPAMNEKHSFDVTLSDGSQRLEWNGAAALNATVSGAVDTEDILHVFSSSYWRNRSAARCYGLKIWQDGTLVRDFRPCVYENKGMLYDKVTGSVYRPSPDIPVSRTGILITGDEKPAAYVDYVESDGSIFVDTGVTGKSGTSAEMTMMFFEGNGDSSFLASRKGGSRYYLLHSYPAGTFLYGYGGYYGFGPYAVGETNAVSSSLSAGAQQISVSGTQVVDATDTSEIDTGLNLYLFAMNHDGAPNNCCKGRLYRLTIYQGDPDGRNVRMVRRFRPVRLKNGLVVLWDFVEKKAYPARSATAPYSYVEFSATGPEGKEIKQCLSIVIQ